MFSSSKILLTNLPFCHAGGRNAGQAEGTLEEDFFMELFTVECPSCYLLYKQKLMVLTALKQDFSRQYLQIIIWSRHKAIIRIQKTILCCVEYNANVTQQIQKCFIKVTSKYKTKHKETELWTPIYSHRRTRPWQRTQETLA